MSPSSAPETKPAAAQGFAAAAAPKVAESRRATTVNQTTAAPSSPPKPSVLSLPPVSFTHLGFKAAYPARFRRSNVVDLPFLSLPPHATINCAIRNLKGKDNGLNRTKHSLPTCLPTLPSLASILPALPALSAFSVLLWSCALVFALKCVDATASQCASLLLLAAGTISWQLSPWVRVLCAL